jgi:TonB family protein
MSHRAAVIAALAACVWSLPAPAAGSPAESAAAGSSADSAAAPKSDSLLSRWVEAVSRADSACVMRVEPRADARPDSTRHGSRVTGTRIVSQCMVGPDWVARFAALVGTCARFDPDGRCIHPESATNDSGVLLDIRFKPNPTSHTARISWRDDCVELFDGRRPAGAAGIESVRPRLLALMREALARDEAVARLAAKPPPPPDRSATGGELPKMGDYVFVEELPEAITRVAPQYPDAARNSGITGTVIVQALVDREGKVRETHVTRSIPGLDEAAVHAVEQWVFKPARSKGEPVAVWVAVPVRFNLH